MLVILKCIPINFKAIKDWLKDVPLRLISLNNGSEKEETEQTLGLNYQGSLYKHEI